MKLQIPTRIVQILFAVPFAFFGINHLMMGSQMSGMVPIPPQTVWIYVTGVAQLLAAIAFVLNLKVRLAAYLLALYVLVVILTIQLPHTLQHMEGASMMLVKDIGLMAGALLLGNNPLMNKPASVPI